MAEPSEMPLQPVVSGVASLPTPPPSPPLPLSSTTDVERNSKISHAYPFIYSPLPDREVGKLGESLNEQYDPLAIKDRLLDTEGLRKRHGKKKGLHEFYDKQNERIKHLLKPLPQHVDDANLEALSHRSGIKFAITASLIANCCLAILQIYAAVSSLSLSFFASAIDAIFDPLVTIILFWLSKKAPKVDHRKWPAGGDRLISVGNIVYCGIMLAASVILIVQCIQDLATHKSTDVEKFHLPATIAVAIALAIKTALFAYCFTLRRFASQVQILFEDHRNDMFLNAFALFTNAAGAKIIWWIDPMGAIIISVILVYLWGNSCLSELRQLAGIAAPDDFRELVIYKAMTFSSEISAIDTCRCFHWGSNYIIELDVVMPPQTSLWKAHDISQVLQDQLEALPKVARAYVHIDHDTEHAPEHRKFA